MKLSDRQRTILTNAIRDCERYRAMRRDHRTQHATLFTAIHEAQTGGYVRVDYLAWFGQPPTNSDYAATSRNLVQLEKRGLIERGDTQGWFRVTPAGERALRTDGVS